MKLFISFLISLMLIFSTPFAYALSGDPSDFVKPVSSKIVDGKLITQYDVQYKGVVKKSSGFLNKIEVGKLMGKGFRKYFPALRALDLVQMALDSGLLFDNSTGVIYEKVEQKDNDVRVLSGTNILITRTANAPSGKTCMEVFNFYLANNQRNTTSATLISCYYNNLDQIQLGLRDLNVTSMDYNGSYPIYRKLATDLVSPDTIPDLKEVDGFYSLPANDETIGSLVLDNVPLEALADMTVYTPEFQSPSAIRAIEAVKNEFGDYEYKYDDVTTPKTGIGLAPTTEVSTSQGSQTNTDTDTDTGTSNPETSPEGGFSFPSFCDWARPVCDAVDYFREPPPDIEQVELPETDINLDHAATATKDYVSFGGSCPADLSIPIQLAGVSQDIVLSYSPFCEFATKIRPAIILGAWVSGLMIISGGRQRE